MILRTGVDILEIERVKEITQRHGDHFLNRVFSKQEINDSNSKPESLAARFAAKEAVAKALGSGIGKVGWLDIEILSGENRQPYLILHNHALFLSKQQNLTEWSISLSHNLHYAIAIAVAIGENKPLP